VLIRILSACSLVASLLLANASQAWDAQKLISAARVRSPEAVTGVNALQELIKTSTAHDLAEKLRMSNDFFNRRIAFQEDKVVWGRDDYWASPVELLEKGRGDCEDYAIAKYFTLLAMGVPVAKLRLVYSQARLAESLQAHLVLAYYESSANDAPLILDNLVQEIRPASRRPDLMPVFSFNSEGLWQGVGSQSAGNSAARLSRWRDVLAKARQEGIQ
jgi:predicted transglutaminase-like cysteine proteinase